MALSEYLHREGANEPEDQPSGPVWEGPESVGQNGGITFSLLSRFLVCRERFRVKVIEGLRPKSGWNHRIGYGEMWHACEEAFAAHGDKPMISLNGTKAWEDALLQYAHQAAAAHPMDRERIQLYYNVCRRQFPLYVSWWKEHPEVVHRKPLFQEKAFRVPYPLPSGRIVQLRGKWDAVDLIWKGDGGKADGIYLQENKTKGDVDPQQLFRQLGFDLQTMLYLSALSVYQVGAYRGAKAYHLTLNKKQYPIRGVRYNVVRRPLSGGKGTIRRKEPSKSNPRGETWADYYDRLETILRECPEEYFFRWTVDLSMGDIAKFRKETLDPVLEQLCEWWDYIRYCQGDPFSPKYNSDHRGIHWRHPFGVYNVLDEGGSSDLDEYLATGSRLGLERVDNLFPELS